ncbi:hypothetical protein HP439_17565, partial [Sphingobacterium shayense]|uniref:GAP1-N1 domain-containing protein n=1 Tax=Sphingobacterium shayense TaxID=626343 RepID=UPI001C1306A1
MLFNFQIHKYKNGHQLLAGTILLERTDQDTIDRLSDISGQLRPGESFAPYFTCYPVPSMQYFVIAKTWQDMTAPRAGCVLTKSVIIAMDLWETLKNTDSVFASLNESEFGFDYPVVSEEVTLNPLNFDDPIEELIEALFLEPRKPILLVDSKSALQIIARLYK